MAKLLVQAQASANRSEYVFVQDSASTTGGGKTGIAYNASGLTVYYVRPGGSATVITLATQTVTGAWSSGGWVEVDATNLPGIYRFDIPNAVFATGADHAVVMLKGASGMAPVSLEYQLTGFNPSTAWLTSAQTASAVWGADPSPYTTATTFGGILNEDHQLAVSTDATVNQIPNLVWDETTSTHTTHGSFGYNLLRADATSKQGLVTLHQSGGISRVDADIHAIVNDTDAAIELKGALLHNGTDYISADPITPVNPATTVRPGPFLLRSGNGIAGDPLDIQKGSVASIDLQCVDANTTGVDITGATITTKVYNSAGTLVATYTNTTSYPAGGRTLCPIDATVTGTSGTYTANVWVVNGSNTTIYGPLRIYVRDI